MRHFGRAGAGLATATALLMLITGTALAGNFGAVTIIDGAEGPPVAGEEREIRFSLLQHGVSPIEDGRVDVTLTLPGTEETFTTGATHVGDGIWSATVTFPIEGDWQVSVAHQWFETSPPSSLAVASGNGLAWLPVAAAVGALAAFAVLVVVGMTRLRGHAIAREPIRARG